MSVIVAAAVDAVEVAVGGDGGDGGDAVRPYDTRLGGRGAEIEGLGRPCLRRERERERDKRGRGRGRRSGEGSLRARFISHTKMMIGATQ